jgi:hypothetical protein
MMLGAVLGLTLGAVLGLTLGAVLGLTLGAVLGLALGALLGAALGRALGAALTVGEGLAVGDELEVGDALTVGDGLASATLEYTATYSVCPAETVVVPVVPTGNETVVPLADTGPANVVHVPDTPFRTAKKYDAFGVTDGSETFTPSVPSSVTFETAVKPRYTTAVCEASSTPRCELAAARARLSAGRPLGSVA